MSDLLSRIDDLISHPEFVELHVNSVHGASLHLVSSRQSLPSPYGDSEVMTREIQEFAFQQKKRLDPFYPANGGVLSASQLRWHAVLSPIARFGPVISIRRHRFQSIELSHFGDPNGLLPLIRDHVAAQRSLLVCGPTASGKTSFLSALLKAVAAEERVIVLEDIPELECLSQNWISLQTRCDDANARGLFSLEQVFKEALRLSPDRLVVGEIRGKEMEIFCHAIATGHFGGLTTCHAGSITQLAARFAMPEQIELGAVFLKRGSPKPEITSFSCFQKES